MSSEIDNQSLRGRLRKYPGALEGSGWRTGDLDYLLPCKISSADIAELIQVALEWCNDEFHIDSYNTDFEDHPVIAWRILGQLRAKEAVVPLISMLNQLDEAGDEWYLNEFPAVFGLIGEPAIQPLIEFFSNDANQSFARTCAADSIQQVALQAPELRLQAIQALENVLARCRPGEEEFAALLVANLLDLDATEAADTLERVHSENLVDVLMCGDWSQVKQELGIQGIGLPMPETPFNSVRPIDSPKEKASKAATMLFDEGGEIDYESLEEQNLALDFLFRHSAEFAPVKYDYGGWPDLFLRLAAEYCGVSFLDITSADAEEIVFEIFPRKVTTEADNGRKIVDELRQFFKLVEREFKTRHSQQIARSLNSSAGAQLESLLADESNFGIAKSMFTQGLGAGFDMRDEADVSQFMSIYNESLNPPESIATPDKPKMTADVKREWNKKRKKKLAKKLQKKKRR